MSRGDFVVQLSGGKSLGTAMANAFIRCQSNGKARLMVLGHNRFILLVEDSQDDIDLTLRALDKQGITNPVIVVKDGAQAIDFLLGRGEYQGRDLKELPVLVLLDINLPRLSGIEVLRIIRQNQPTRMIPVVMLTTSKQDQDVVESYSSGANSYVQKPIDFAEFSEAVRQLGNYWLTVNEAP